MKKWNDMSIEEREDRCCYVLAGITCSSLVILTHTGVL